MSLQDVVPLLQAIIDRERKGGCTMAHESLIEPALRRWRSYERRNKRNKDKSFEHRAHDLTKGLLEWYPDYGYDTACIRHLAESFADVLLNGFESSLKAPGKSEPPLPTHNRRIQPTASNAEIEMRWVNAWSQLYEVLGKSHDAICQLPDCSVVDIEACKSWLQQSVYEGYLVRVDAGWVGQNRGIIVSRSLPDS